MPPDPQSQAEEDAAFAPSDAFYKQAKTLYASGDLAGAEAACLNALNNPPVFQGRTLHVPFVADLLGQVYLKDGQYEKAIYWLQGARHTTMDSSLNLNLALAYLKQGDFQTARRHYSAEAAAKAMSTLNEYSPQDLPGTDTPDALEASILMARGVDASCEDRMDDALPDLQRANQLAPDNALVAYHYARLLNEKGRLTEALPLYEQAASKSHGRAASDAGDHIAGIRSALRYRAAHPEKQFSWR
ncbi:MAG: tetratricopeptide repeat protein [Armatimonadota bacterium]|nr:tetratricopeptide repeat protein [Armatimonadota bacterium]